MTSKSGVVWDGDVCSITLPINPVPAARPRVGRYGTFYPKSYATWRAQVKEFLSKYKLKNPHEHETYVEVTFIVSKPGKPSRAWPRGDIDNYVKAFLDAVTTAQLYWYDDACVTKVVMEKRYAEKGEAPRVEATIRKL